MAVKSVKDLIDELVYLYIRLVKTHYWFGCYIHIFLSDFGSSIYYNFKSILKTLYGAFLKMHLSSFDNTFISNSNVNLVMTIFLTELIFSCACSTLEITWKR